MVTIEVENVNGTFINQILRIDDLANPTRDIINFCLLHKLSYSFVKEMNEVIEKLRIERKIFPKNEYYYPIRKCWKLKGVRIKNYVRGDDNGDDENNNIIYNKNIHHNKNYRVNSTNDNHMNKYRRYYTLNNNRNNMRSRRNSYNTFNKSYNYLDDNDSNDNNNEIYIHDNTKRNNDIRDRSMDQIRHNNRFYNDNNNYNNNRRFNQDSDMEDINDRYINNNNIYNNRRDKNNSMDNIYREYYISDGNEKYYKNHDNNYDNYNDPDKFRYLYKNRNKTYENIDNINDEYFNNNRLKKKNYIKSNKNRYDHENFHNINNNESDTDNEKNNKVYYSIDNDRIYNNKNNSFNRTNYYTPKNNNNNTHNNDSFEYNKLNDSDIDSDIIKITNKNDYLSEIKNNKYYDELSSEKNFFPNEYSNNNNSNESNNKYNEEGSNKYNNKYYKDVYNNNDRYKPFFNDLNKYNMNKNIDDNLINNRYNNKTDINDYNREKNIHRLYPNDNIDLRRYEVIDEDKREIRRVNSNPNCINKLTLNDKKPSYIKDYNKNKCIKPYFTYSDYYRNNKRKKNNIYQRNCITKNSKNKNKSIDKYICDKNKNKDMNNNSNKKNNVCTDYFKRFKNNCDKINISNDNNNKINNKTYNKTNTYSKINTDSPKRKFIQKKDNDNLNYIDAYNSDNNSNKINIINKRKNRKRFEDSVRKTLDEIQSRNKKKDKNEDNGMPESFLKKQLNTTRASSFNDIYNRSKEYSLKYNEKIKKIREQQEKILKEKCTFSPKIDISPLILSSIRKKMHSNCNNKDAILHYNLYKESLINKYKRKLFCDDKQYLKEKENENECTFSPKISSFHWKKMKKSVGNKNNDDVFERLYCDEKHKDHIKNITSKLYCEVFTFKPCIEQKIKGDCPENKIYENYEEIMKYK